jgi:hypothetical protein
MASFFSFLTNLFMLSFGGFCKRIKMKKIYIEKKKHSLLSVYKYEFLLCNKLSENHSKIVHLVSFLCYYMVFIISKDDTYT